ARVKVTRGTEITEEEMTKVEGKWVPKKIADEWDTQIAEAKEKLAQMTGTEMVNNKPQVLAMLSTVDAGLTAMGNAKTAEELKQAAMGVGMSIMQQMMSGGLPGPSDDMQ